MKARRKHRGSGGSSRRLLVSSSPRLYGLAAKKGLSRADFPERALAVGRRVEMEHTDDWRVAEQIAMDHLTEDLRYYEKLLRYVERRKS